MKKKKTEGNQRTKTASANALKQILTKQAKNRAAASVKKTVVGSMRTKILIPAYQNWCRGEHKSLAMGLLLKKLSGR